ncbi:uncharacterized protein RSE6_04679 [Rhynchosporium secalis]|uniref:Glycosyl transferase CAP10 domain-containing protein n=1 Tax=Rhynchosporium secalis TaxID=38038 RepID=A0A1E1M786_RHYSE|nr:uncharacterized protein RSE6_04679 [Rhynchosporium secalis]
MILTRPKIQRAALFVTLVIVLYNIFALFTQGRSYPSLLPSSLIKYPTKEKFENRALSEEQCRATFPGLTKEIDDAVARGSFTFGREPSDSQGLVQGRIKNGKLYIISADSRASQQMLYERDAVLHQIYRAIITSPTLLPDTIFTYSIIDYPRQDAWAFSRDPNMPGDYWVMPHFSFWSWPLPFIGTMDEALAKISNVEKNTSWDKKIDKVVWRGTAWFNSIRNTNLRPQLLKATKGKEWADVENLQWVSETKGANNSISIEDFCKYKYIIYTEASILICVLYVPTDLEQGITYSGRLPFHQACKSVIITPPPSYLMHTTHLMRPLFSSNLPFSASTNSKTSAGPNTRWMESYAPSQANIVFVDPHWADLEQTVMWLRAHPSVAEGIAERQRELVESRGILSAAAETCYWRSLIRGWSEVAIPEASAWKDVGEGVRWETFSLSMRSGWE